MQFLMDNPVILAALITLILFLGGMVLLGIRAQRKESSIGMAISLAVALSYYLVVILMSSLSKNFKAQPEFLIWLPVLACLLLASYLVPKNL